MALFDIVVVSGVHCYQAAAQMVVHYQQAPPKAEQFPHSLHYDAFHHCFAHPDYLEEIVELHLQML